MLEGLKFNFYTPLLESERFIISILGDYKMPSVHSFIRTFITFLYKTFDFGHL